MRGTTVCAWGGGELSVCRQKAKKTKWLYTLSFRTPDGTSATPKRAVRVG